MKITGRVWKFGDDINTDLMQPAIAFRLPFEEQLKLVFSANRPGWVEQVKPDDIIIGGRNFGTGSSRPGAALLKGLGIGCLVAHSINGLFLRNCVNHGLPALECLGVYQAFEEGDVAAIDLEAGTVRNLRTDQVLQGVQLPESLLKIVRAGGNIALLEKEGYL